MSSTGLSAGNPDGEDPAAKAQRLAARAARFGNRLPGNRAKELEETRILERKRFEEQGLITAGKTELGDAVEMKGACEDMCSEYERETREFRGEIGQFERVSHNPARSSVLCCWSACLPALAIPRCA